MFRVSADSPLLDCSSILCLPYSRLSTSDREGGGWNVTGALIGPGSCFSSCLLLLRRVEIEFLISATKIYYIFDEFRVTINKTVETLLRPFVMKHQEFGKRVLDIGALSRNLVFTIAVDFRIKSFVR